VGWAKSRVPGAPVESDGMDSAILANEALKLPPLERAQIIDALWNSLDPAKRDAIDQAWLLESQDRLAAFRAGQLKASNACRLGNGSPQASGQTSQFQVLSISDFRFCVAILVGRLHGQAVLQCRVLD
jgi:putative addiction module component (TIGR02574 family)